MNYCRVNTVVELWICTKQKKRNTNVNYPTTVSLPLPSPRNIGDTLHIHFTHNDIRLLRYYCVAGPAWFGCPNPEDKRYEINHRYEQKLHVIQGDHCPGAVKFPTSPRLLP